MTLDLYPAELITNTDKTQFYYNMNEAKLERVSLQLRYIAAGRKGSTHEADGKKGESGRPRRRMRRAASRPEKTFPNVSLPPPR
jgi:hypothetical protein